jgi:4a-hydroxytetrahydrobiopterin dehydratase
MSLTSESCVATVSRLSASEAEALHGEASEWAVVDGVLTRTFRFKDYFHTMAFVNAVAWVAHAEDHHPDLHVSYATCEVRFSTHSVGGLSRNDFICAAKVDALMFTTDGTPRLPA